MKLKMVTIEKFRCYKAPLSVAFDDMTTLVGRNDTGKSALLDALDVFFNDKALDKNDAAKGGNPKAVTIICTFTSLPQRLVLDETVLTNLADEHLLNVNGDLEIIKIFNCSIEKPKLSSLRVKAVHPTADEAKDLLVLKIDELKARAEQVGVDMNAVNKTVKRELRQAIRDKIVDLNPANTDVVLIGDGVDDKSNASNVWEGLKTALPLYALFKSDRQSSDQEHQSPSPCNRRMRSTRRWPSSTSIAGGPSSGWSSRCRRARCGRSCWPCWTAMSRRSSPTTRRQSGPHSTPPTAC